MTRLRWVEWKVRLLDAAEITDAWRLVPRSVLAAYGYLCWQVHLWYTALKVPPTPEQAAYATAIIGLAIPLTAFYMQNGRKWQP